MADISAKTAVNVTNDVKLRSLVPDILPADTSASQFMDVMTARMTSLQSDDKDLQDIAQKLDDAGNARDANLLRHLKGLREKKGAAPTAKNPEAAEQTLAIKEKIKEKIKARVQEIAATNDIPVKDDSSLKALREVAEFLVKASEEGKIQLPKELVEKLQAFLAKGEDFKAYDIANFMRDLSDTFKTMIVALNNSSASKQGEQPEQTLEWPQELVDQLKELNMGGLAQASKEVSTFDAVRVLKALVNSSEKAALATLDEKIEQAMPKDRVDILVNAAAKDAQPQAEKSALNTDAGAPVDANPSAETIVEATADVASKVIVESDDEEVVALDADADPLVVKSSDKQPGDANNVKTAVKSELPLDPKADPKAEVKEKAPTPVNNAAILNAALRVQLSNAALPNGEANLGQSVSAVAPGVTNVNALDNLNATVNGNSSARFSAALSAAQEAHQPSEATQQVIVQLQQRGNKPGSLSVQLSPAELGRVDVRLTTQRDGSVHAVIAADKPETLALLQKDASTLERALQNAGINANAGNMSFNLREQRQSQQFDGGRKRFSRADIEEVSTKEIALNVTEQGVFTKDHVNYHA